jgi:hypothetical protein
MVAPYYHPFLGPFLMAFFFVMLRYGTGSDLHRSFAVSTGVFGLALDVLILMLAYATQRASSPECLAFASNCRTLL